MGKKKIKKGSKLSKKLSRFLVFVVIMLIGLILLKSNASLRESIYKNVFQNNLKFAKINEIYEKFFGSSLPLTGNKSNISMASSEKLQYKSLKKFKDGAKLMVSDSYAIPIINSGIVVFTGEKEGYGNTVIVQGADDVEIWYSNLKDIKVSMYDYLKKGSIIGEANGDNFILVFTKDGKVQDYKKFI